MSKKLIAGYIITVIIINIVNVVYKKKSRKTLLVTISNNYTVNTYLRIKFTSCELTLGKIIPLHNITGFCYYKFYNTKFVKRHVAVASEAKAVAAILDFQKFEIILTVSLL